MTMFTAQKKKSFKQLLALAVNKDEVLSLDGLHGFLYGLAIIPEAVMPSEWFPGIFGEEMLE
jgi:yecA family protein